MEKIEYGNLVLFKLTGDLPVKLLLELKSSIADARRNKQAVALDLTEVNTLNSNAVGFFSNAQKMLKDAGRELYLVAPNEDVYEIMDLVGLQKKMPVFLEMEKFLAEVVPKYKK
jgi:anti-anti-sigma factor